MNYKQQLGIASGAIGSLLSVYVGYKQAVYYGTNTLMHANIF